MSAAKDRGHPPESPHNLGGRRLSEPDEALLRELLTKTAAIDVKLEQLASVTSEAQIERRKHTAAQERKIGALEERVRLLEVHDARGESMPEMVKDHESRIRSLEAIGLKLLATILVGTAVTQALLWVVDKFILT